MLFVKEYFKTAVDVYFLEALMADNLELKYMFVGKATAYVDTMLMEHYLDFKDYSRIKKAIEYAVLGWD